MRQGTDWDKLWKRLREVYLVAGQDRQVAVLDNHADRKEEICRKLGVVSDADVGRIGKEVSAFRK